MSLNQTLTKLERELGGFADDVPKGFRTVQEWADLWVRSHNYASKILNGHVNAGRMEMKRFRIATDRFKSRPVNHYRAIK